MSDGLTKRPQYMRISRLITVMYLPFDVLLAEMAWGQAENPGMDYSSRSSDVQLQVNFSFGLLFYRLSFQFLFHLSPPQDDQLSSTFTTLHRSVTFLMQCVLAFELTCPNEVFLETLAILAILTILTTTLVLLSFLFNYSIPCLVFDPPGAPTPNLQCVHSTKISGFLQYIPLFQHVRYEVDILSIILLDPALLMQGTKSQESVIQMRLSESGKDSANFNMVS